MTLLGMLFPLLLLGVPLYEVGNQEHLHKTTRDHTIYLQQHAGERCPETDPMWSEMICGAAKTPVIVAPPMSPTRKDN